MKDINPMDWHNTRYVNSMPAHFVQVKIKDNNKVALLNWITKNTSGRYSMVANTQESKDSNYFVQEEKFIGFEDPADATMYSLFYK